MTLPVIGAALMTAELPLYRDWLFDKDRDLELQDFFRPELMLDGAWRPVVEAARATLDGFRGRLGIHGPFWDLPLDAQDPGIRAVVVDRFTTAIEVCSALGATQMVIHSPFSTWDGNNLGMDSTARRLKLKAVAQTMGPVVDRAREAGVTLVVENIEDTDPEDRKALAAHLGAEVVKLSIDTGHAHYAHGSTGAPPVDYFVRSAGAELAHVHLQDADGHADRHWAIGRGTILWPSVFAALAETGAQPHLVLELRNSAGIPESMAFLEGLGLGQ